MQKYLFVPEEYEEMTCMSFKDREECVAFSEYLDSIGKHWRDGERYTDRNKFDEYSGETVYYFNKGMYGSMTHAMEMGYTILNYVDFYFCPDESPQLETDVELTFNKLFGYE